MRFLAVVFAISVLSACGLKPWVKPYERGFLADPLMSLSADPIADTHTRHVFETRESSRGAVAGAGGGCGCN